MIENYLKFCSQRKQLNVFKNFYAKCEKGEILIKKGSKIKINNFEIKDKIHINFELLKPLQPATFEFNWNEEIPFTHYLSAKELLFIRSDFVAVSENIMNFLFSKDLLSAIKFALRRKERFSNELEQKIFKKPHLTLVYCRQFDITLTQEQEKIFLSDKYGKHLLYYSALKQKNISEECKNYLLALYLAKESNPYKNHLEQYFSDKKFTKAYFDLISNLITGYSDYEKRYNVGTIG